MKRAETVEDMWQGFAAAVGVPVGDVQWTETRRAFFAGCHAMLTAVKNIPDDEAAGVAQLQDYEAEVHGFFDRIARGAA